MDDTLAKLKDIHLPPPISGWPPAVGWWLLAIVIIIALGFGLKKLIGYLHARKKQRLALEAVQTLLQQHGDNHKALIQSLSVLLRELAIHLYGKSRCATLIDEEWLIFLNASGQTEEFTQGIGRLFVTAPYDNQALSHPKALVALVNLWIKKQRWSS